MDWACVAHLSFCFEETEYRTFHRCFPPNFGSFGKAVSEKKIFRNRPIWSKNCLWRQCLLMDQNEMSNLYRGPSIDASYQVSYHFAKRFQRKRCFRNRSIRYKNCLWWPCLLMDRDEMSNLYRGPSIDLQNWINESFLTTFVMFQVSRCTNVHLSFFFLLLLLLFTVNLYSKI